MKIVSGKKLLNILKSKGWVVVKIEASHHKLSHPDEDFTVVVPVHSNRDLKVGLLKRIMKDTGLDEKDLS
ncbi:MAG: hypothetical protein IEMM0008_1511 [bacterium]|nr:MAG: hypothetical protein IEMM0008_1511 [bacterium]